MSVHFAADIKVNECQVLYFFKDLLLVLVDKLILVLLRINETRPWEIIYMIDGPQRIVNSTVTRQIICMIDSDHSICILSSNIAKFQDVQTFV